jgi:hypothetical protein|tara:strand:+ start:1158 stop:1298 length:141 start_codon:yes stop_codon:yes gene_type:complete
MEIERDKENQEFTRVERGGEETGSSIIAQQRDENFAVDRQIKNNCS